MIDMFVFLLKRMNLDHGKIKDKIKRKNIEVHVHDDRDDVPFKLEVNNDIDDKKKYQDIYERGYFL
jgi:hypothetical protein